MSPRRWSALETFLLGELDLARSTTTKTLRSLEYMERHGFPIEQPTPRAFGHFLAARKRAGRPPTSSGHYRKAVRRLFLYHGLQPPNLQAPRTPRPEIFLLPDEHVRRLIDYPALPGLTIDELDTLRFSYAFGFYIGLRTPSEPTILRVQDFDRATRELKIYAPKVRRADVLVLEPWLAQLVQDYIDGPRTRIAHPREKALLVNPKRRSKDRGRAFTPECYRMWLWRHGRGIHPRYRVYGMRHWAITQRAIQWDLDVLMVKTWARHAQIANTMRYIHAAEQVARRLATSQFRPLAPLASAAGANA